MEISSVGADLFGDADAAVLRVLALQGRPVSGREAARLALRNQSSTRRALARWVAVGLVEAETASHAMMFRLNRDHVLWPPLEAILASPVRIERVIADLVAERSGGKGTVAMFGSVARRESRADSDIDLVLVIPETMTAPEAERLHDDLIETVERLTGNPVHVLEVSRDQLRTMVEQDDPLVRSWKDESRTLTGEDLHALIAAD